MARLPEVGGDSGSWGQVLNEYLEVAHNTDGTLKSGSVGASVLQDDAVTVAKIATSTTPTSGQSLTYDGSGLTWSAVSGSTPDATDTTKGVVQLAGDLGGTAASPTVPGLAGKQAIIPTGTTTQYYRGDKSWQTLDKIAVGLSNVDNTSDANKPVSTATQTALDGKANTSHVHSGADITSGTVAADRLPVASETASGVVELATVEEAETGTDSTRAVTAAGVKAAIDTAVEAIPPAPILFVDNLADIPPGTPVDTLVVVRSA